MTAVAAICARPYPSRKADRLWEVVKPAASCEACQRPPTDGVTGPGHDSRHGALKETLSDSVLPTVHPVDRNEPVKPFEGCV